MSDQHPARLSRSAARKLDPAAVPPVQPVLRVAAFKQRMRDALLAESGDVAGAGHRHPFDVPGRRRR